MFLYGIGIFCFLQTFGGFSLFLGVQIRFQTKKSYLRTFNIVVNRYQSSNNGNFPSLNLTHKEVGGSFYTVREIVREIIQENRVLGPGQISSEEQREDTFALDYPLGTMSSEPQGVPFTTESEMNDFTNLEREETVVLNFDNSVQYTKHFEVGDVQYSIEHRTDGIGEAGDSELVFKPTGETVGIYNHQEQASFGTSLNRDGQCFSVNETDSVNVMDHTQTMMLEESDKQLAEVTPGYETFEEDGESGDMGVIQATLVLPTEEVEVETFPLRPAIIETDDFGSILTDSKNFDRNFEDLEDKEAKFSNSTLLSDKVGSSDTSSELVTTKEADDSEVSVSESHDMMAQHPEVNYMVEVNHKNDSVDMSYSLPMKKDTATIPECMNQASQLGDSTSKAAEQNNYQVSFYLNVDMCVSIVHFFMI